MPRRPRRRGADRLRDRRRDRRPGGRQHAGQRLGAADRPLQPRPPGDPRRGRPRSTAPIRSAGRFSSLRRMASFTLERGSPPRRRSSSTSSSTTAATPTSPRCASPSSSARATPRPNGVGAIRVIRTDRPAAARGSRHLRGARAASPTVLSGAPIRDHVGTAELEPRRRRHEDRLRGPDDADAAARRRRRRRRHQAGGQAAPRRRRGRVRAPRRRAEWLRAAQGPRQATPAKAKLPRTRSGSGASTGGSCIGAGVARRSSSASPASSSPTRR